MNRVTVLSKKDKERRDDVAQTGASLRAPPPAPRKCLIDDIYNYVQNNTTEQSLVPGRKKSKTRFVSIPP